MTIKNITYKCISTVLRPLFSLVKSWIQLRFLQYYTHEEKKTDVNIAVKIFEDAYLNDYDKAYIISWDTDIIPWIEAVKNNFPTKKFTAIIPVKAKWKWISKVCGDRILMTEPEIKASLFPDEIIKSDWTKIVKPIDRI